MRTARVAAEGDAPIKLYFDYKSPFAFLAMQPAFDLPERYRVDVRWIPYLLRIKGRGERSIYSEWKARYSYMDARRWANRRGGFPIRGPLKVYDSTAALIGGLFAQERDLFRPYTEAVYARFFERALEIDLPQAIAALIDELGSSGAEYLAWAEGEGRRRFEACLEEGHADHVFGVPLFLFEGEAFWGHDRIPLLEERLSERGLRRAAARVDRRQGGPGSMDRDAFRRAVEARDLDEMMALFEEKAVLHSPVTFQPFEGREAIRQLFSILFQVFEGFHYTDALEAPDGTKALVFRAQVRDREVEGLDLIRFGDSGRIRDFTVFVRPRSALEALLAEVGPRLAAARESANPLT